VHATARIVFFSSREKDPKREIAIRPLAGKLSIATSMSEQAFPQAGRGEGFPFSISSREKISKPRRSDA